MLQTFLAEHGARPLVWGEVDCCLVLADWLVANGYPDVAAHLRGTYTTEQACRRVIESHGGVLSIVSDLAIVAGLKAVAYPAAGSIAVIGSRAEIHRQWGAIHDGARWQVRLQDGFVALAAAPLAIWEV